MAPKDATKATNKTWDDAKEKQFLLDIIHEFGTTVPTSVFQKLAEKMGPPNTKESLRVKFTRMKDAIAKANGEAGGQGKRKVSEDADVGKAGDDGGKKAKKVKKEKKGEDSKIDSAAEAEAA